jgi:hypothetical protein
MNDIGSGESAGDGGTGSWACETLPMDVRKQLLERELKKLGLRKSGHDAPAGQQQQQPQGSSHPGATDGGEKD